MHAHAVPPPHSELLAQCVFFNPELLDTIFNFLDKKTNVTNALVCKQWSQIALDVVWKEVDDLVLLLNLLKPVCEVTRPSQGSYWHLHVRHVDYVFKAMPEANDWLRFQRYAFRVRCLRFHSNKYTADVNRLLDDVAISRTYLDILPNMHTLEWVSGLEDTMARGKLFLHQRLRHLTITADGFRPRDFHMDICTRASHLHTLKLFIQHPQEHHKDELRTLVRNLPELRKIVLPEFHFTSSLIEDLSRAKNIRVVELNLNTNVFCGASKNVETFAPVLAEGAFPSLLNLGLVAKIDHLDRFFRSNFAPINITTLHINTYQDYSPSNVHNFLVTLSQQCRLLSKLYIQFDRLFEWPRPITVLVPEDQLFYGTIEPLLTLSKLVTFELVHRYPLKITLDEIEELASRWPSLESLVLNVEPHALDEDGFTLDLRALLPFARHCSRLWKLGLYLDATKGEIPSVQSSVEPFHSLRVLSLGASRACDPDTVAAFLGRVCPPSCVLEFDMTWDGWYFENRIVEERRQRQLLWKAITALLPGLIPVREEQDNSTVLREEVEDIYEIAC